MKYFTILTLSLSIEIVAFHFKNIVLQNVVRSILIYGILIHIAICAQCCYRSQSETSPYVCCCVSVLQK